MTISWLNITKTLIRPDALGSKPTNNLSFLLNSVNHNQHQSTYKTIKPVYKTRIYRAPTKLRLTFGPSRIVCLRFWILSFRFGQHEMPTSSELNSFKISELGPALRDYEMPTFIRYFTKCLCIPSLSSILDLIFSIRSATPNTRCPNMICFMILVLI